MINRQHKARGIVTYGECPPSDNEQLEANTLVIEDEALRRGFTSAPNYILDDNSVSLAARLTYIILLSFAWQAGSCFPGQTRLAQKLGVSRQMVNRYLTELKVKGFIDWQRRGLGKTNVYHILKVQPKSEADVNYSLHQDVKSLFHPNGKQGLHKEDSVDEHTERKDSDISKFRKGRTLENINRNRPYERQSTRTAISLSELQKNSRKDRISSKIAIVFSNLSKRDLQDPVHERSNITRAMNLWRHSKLSEHAFLELVREARKITLNRSGSIHKRSDDYMGFKNRAPYFFRVLQDLIHRHTVTHFRKELIARKSMT